MDVRSEPSFTMSMPKSSLVTQPSISGMRLTVTPDGTAVYKPITPTTPMTTISSSSVSPFHGGNAVVSPDGPPAASLVTPSGLNVGGGGGLVKKKRGRPRKYGPDGSMALALTTISPTSAETPGFSLLSAGQINTDLSVSDPLKKARGKPSGSGKKHQLLALGSAGTGFTPHVITVKAGEDVSSKIMSFFQHGPRAICILSANGAISNVTLRQAATSGGTVTYEGRFEILSLSGSFLLSENDDQRSRTGGLSISLAGPDGRVLGGGVAGLLTAASPVQVVVGSFIADGKKELKNINLLDGITNMAKLAPGDNFYGGSGGGGGVVRVGVTTGGISPPSRGTLSESYGGPPSPLNQSTGTCNDSNLQGLSGISWK
ncbi:AT-hook motif nuclear-localized protein 10 [Dendrobium catenatum]|uniref:AT-hook motif nuclear-localized protein 10 n=1 Tax=Dendrobium catenatum TaxID=906689 RepID=UPI0009F32511|nr:AT-hook motif nuclear-localized protein 10 [Dendrobium catenatum]